MLITSKSNPLIKKISSLTEKKYRKEYGLYVVEGVKPVNECILAGCEIDTVVTIPAFEGRYQNQVIVSEQVFASISEEKTPQGVLALVKLPKNELESPKGCCLLLDNIQDPGNMGTIIRTANASGYEEIYMIHCVDPYSQKAVRASMSGIFFVKTYQGEREDVLNALSKTPLICADMDGVNIFDFKAPNKFCLCIGNEGNGISEEVMNKATYTVKIPMRSTCESLNAGVSAGIAMYQLMNNRNN